MINFRYYKIFGYTVISVAVFLILLRITAAFLLPNSIEWVSYIKDQFAYPLNIESTTVTFNGWYPVVECRGVDVFTTDKQLALTADQVKLILDPYAFLFKRVELKDLLIEGMKIRVNYDLQTGNAWLNELPKLRWQPNDQTTAKKMSIKHLRIKKSDLHFIIDKNKSLPIAEIDLQMEEGFPTRVRGHAIILNESASTLQFSVDFPIFGKTTTKFDGIWKNASVEQFARWWGNSSPLATGFADLRLWGTIDKKGNKAIFSEIALTDNTKFSGTGWIKANGKDRDWKIVGHWKQKDEAQAFEGSLNTYRCDEKQCYAFQTGNIELEKAITKIPFLAWMQPLEAQGKIQTLSFFARQEGTKIVPIGTSLTFTDLSFKGNEVYPGVQGLSGKIDYQDEKIKLFLNSRQMVIDYPKAFEVPLVIDHLEAQWAALPTENTRVHGVISTLQIADTIFSGNVSIDQKAGKIENIDLVLEGKEWPIQKALTLLPRKVMDNMLVGWLDSALQGGSIQQSLIRFKGNPQDFPFDKQEGLFEAQFGIDNMRLDYDSDWPALNDLKANLIFRNREMQMEAKGGSIANGPLLATAKIPDLMASIPTLYVDAMVHNQLSQAMDVIERSPLNRTIGKSLSALQFSGEFDLGLGLTIPLTKKKGFPVKVDGKMKVKDAKVLVSDWKLQANRLNGTVFFSEKTVFSDDLVGKMLNHRAVFSLFTGSEAKQPDFQIKIKGHVGIHDLEKWLALSNTSIRTDFIAGETDYVATLDVMESDKNQPLLLKIQTDLQGIEIKAPFPFKKDSNTEKASLFSLEWQPHETARIQVKYGEHMNLAMLLKTMNQAWHFQGGQISLGSSTEAKVRNDNILLIDGQIDELNVGEWRAFFLEGASSALSALSFEPLIALNISKLVFEHEMFSKTQLEARWDKVSSLWNFNFDGPSLRGHIVLPEGEDEREIIIDLKKLTVATSDEPSSFDLAEQKVIQRPIEIKIKKLKINGKSITDLQARIEPSWRGYDIPRLQAKLKNTDVSLSAQWDVLSHTKQVTAEGKILTRNTTDLFKSLGITGTVHHAKGNADFSIQWQGSPIKIDTPTLTGKAAFHLTNGYVQGVDPGIGRVLNLLSVDTVQRRLSLDFSDVTQKGFAFDEFIGSFQFGKGKISSNKVSLQGPSANIESYGQASLEDQGINGVIIVMPNVTGSLPVAAAIAAGNPAVGAAVWLVDKIVGKKLQEMHRYYYRLVGTWDAPILQAVSTGRG